MELDYIQRTMATLIVLAGLLQVWLSQLGSFLELWSGFHRTEIKKSLASASGASLVGIEPHRHIVFLHLGRGLRKSPLMPTTSNSLNHQFALGQDTDFVVDLNSVFHTSILPKIPRFWVAVTP